MDELTEALKRSKNMTLEDILAKIDEDMKDPEYRMYVRVKDKELRKFERAIGKIAKEQNEMLIAQGYDIFKDYTEENKILEKEYLEKQKQKEKAKE